MRRPLTVALLLAVAASLFVVAAPAGAQTADPKVLVFSKTAGFRHSSIPNGIAAVQSLGAANGFAVDATEDATQFNAAKLAEYEAVVFLSTTGDVLNPTQQAAFEDYIQGGGGYAGVHAAADTEYEWSWYGDLVGAYFNSHPANQTATVDVEDADHPSTACLPAEWERFDEWYNYRANPRPAVNVLATLDETSYNPGGGAMGADHPIAWYHEFDGGRSWYTGMGHTEASFSDPAYRSHLLGGIQYAAGFEPGECDPGEPDCSASAPASDEFGGAALECPWTVVRRNDARLGLAGGTLNITTANGDLYGGGGDVENLVVQRTPDGDWEATTEVTINATGGSEQAGLIVYDGDDDYVKFGHIARTGEKWFEFFGEHGGSPNFGGTPDRTGALPGNFPTTFQLRISHSGGTLTAAYSTDGTTWTPVGRQQTTADFAQPRVGVFAQTNDDNEVTTAAFDWFHLEGGDEPGEDTIAPTVRAAADGVPTSNGGYLGRAEVTITASDGGSGVESIEYAIGDGAWQPYDGPITLTGDGQQTVRHRATDKAGNTSSPGTTTVTLVGNDCAPVQAEAGYQAIYDGTVGSLAGWRMAGPGGFELGEDPCTIDAHGGMGLLWYAAHELESPYTIRTEWKIYADDDNSGVFIGFPDPGDDPWHPVSNGYEIQIDPTDERVRTTGAIYSFQAPNAARDEAVNAHGEWNVMEVEVDGQDITVRLNGVVVNEYTSPHPERDPATGFVGIQNDGAGRDVTYRSVQVKGGGLPPVDTTAPETAVALDPADPGAGGTYEGPVGVTLSATGAAAFTEYRLDGGEWMRSDNSGNEDPFETAFTVSAEGDHVVEYRSTDAAGNEEQVGSVEFSIAGDGSQAPSVQAFADPTSGAAPLPVQFSATGLDPQGGELVYEWDFGDGGGAVAQSPEHVYTEPGTYTATVTATDEQGETAADTVEIVVSDDGNLAPTVQAASSPAAGTAPLQVSFSAQATDPDGPEDAITYLWDFGDGGANAFGPTATHTYTAPGTYTATVTATDGEGAFDSAEIVVVVGNPPANLAPTVQAAATPRSGTAPVTVRFTSVARDPDGDNVSTVWDFGDGVRAGGANISHTYRQPGTYVATVRVTDPEGATATATLTITVAGPTGAAAGQPAAPNAAADPAPPQGGVLGESESGRRAWAKAPKSRKLGRVMRRGLPLRVGCPERQCDVRAVLRHSGKRIGRSKLMRIRDDRTRRVTVRLDRGLRRNLLAAMRQAGSRQLEVDVVISIRTDDGTRRVRSKVRLKR